MISDAHSSVTSFNQHEVDDVLSQDQKVSPESEVGKDYYVNAYAWQTMEAIGSGMGEDFTSCVSSVNAQVYLDLGIAQFSKRDYAGAFKNITLAMNYSRCCGDIECDIRASINFGTVKLKLIEGKLKKIIHNSASKAAVNDMELMDAHGVVLELDAIIRVYVYSISQIRELRLAKYFRAGNIRPHGTGVVKPEQIAYWFAKTIDCSVSDAALVCNMTETPSKYRNYCKLLEANLTSTKPSHVDVSSVEFERKIMYSLCSRISQLF